MKGDAGVKVDIECDANFHLSLEKSFNDRVHKTRGHRRNYSMCNLSHLVGRLSEKRKGCRIVRWFASG